jgi:hypothetical protein
MDTKVFLTEEERVTNRKIAAQNDLFRKAIANQSCAIAAATQGIAGRRFITPGVAAQVPENFHRLVWSAVANFSFFTEDNDPYEDHTFGAFEIEGVRLFWKIDLYDTAYRYGSDDPANPKCTRRVLTVMLRSEY